MQTNELVGSVMSPATMEGYRLSAQQRILWRRRQRIGFQNVQFGIILPDGVDDRALQSALRALSARHEILRTTYQSMPGMAMPVQVIGTDATIDWNCFDCAGLTPSAQESRISAIAEQDYQVAIEVHETPTIRVSLIALGGGKRLLLISLASLSADRRSLSILARDVAAACAGPSAPTSEEEPMQYVQYAQWQDDLQSSSDDHGSSGLAFWEARTRELPATTAFPFASSARVHNEILTDRVRRRLDTDLTGDVYASAGRTHGSVQSYLETVWAILVARLTGAETVLLGHGCDGRSYPELQGTLGNLSKTLPLVFQLDQSTPFSLTFRAVTAMIADASGWEEYYSPEKLNESADLDVHFDFEDLTDLALPVGWKWHEWRASSDPLLLGLACIRDGEVLALEFQFDAARLEVSDVNRIADMYESLLRSALTRPDCAIGALPMLPKEELARVTVEWNRTAMDFGPFVAVHHLFEAEARRNPGAVAAVFEDQRISYGDLNVRANQLAHHLIGRGAVADTIVALCIERSLDLVTAILAVLKAGAAYLPLDPSLPQERLVGMLADSRAPLLVTTQALSDWLDTSVPAVVLDHNAAAINRECTSDPVIAVEGAHLVYVIYTSGSTGRPKGVAIEHRNLTNYVLGVSEQLGLPMGACYATVSTFAADLGNTAVFPSLCFGGCLHLVSSECAMDSLLWRQYFTKHHIDCLKIVPSHLAALLGGSTEIQDMLPRRTLVLGGESSTWELVDRINYATPSLRVLNHYGPTETTVGVLTYAADDPRNSGRPGSRSVPIGRPLPNSRIYLLNSYREPVPIGVVGELFIGGSGVGRGYLYQPELTASQFVEDTFDESRFDRNETRLYRTGDLARFHHDGSIEFLGRVDHQVKIRGYRIELGEIENALRGHPAVQEAVVTAPEQDAGERQLIAYIVASNSVSDISDLREFLRATLPPVMVPTSIVPMNRLPLTANGKVDRAALPAPVKTGGTHELVAPRNAVQETLAGIWRLLLRRDNIGVTDNFFDIGGHSLLALQVISHVRAALKVELTLKAFFEAPTIEGISEKISKSPGGNGLVRPPVVAAPRGGRLPLSFAQQRLWFIDQLDPGTYLYNAPMAIRLHGTLNVVALKRAIEHIVHRHEILRTTFPSSDGTPFQAIGDVPEFDVAELDLSNLGADARESAANRAVIEEAEKPFDLSTGPLIRATILRLAQEEHWLVVVMHHIVTDGWSKGVFFKEMQALYVDFSSGLPASLPELPIQYADYAAWQREWLQGPLLDSEIAYWRARLAGAPAALDLPTDRPRPQILNPEGAWEHFTIPDSTMEKLLDLGRQEGATLFVTLLAAFNVLLYRVTECQDILVGTDIANRNAREIEDLIGFFLNHVVLRTDLSGSPTFRELLRRERDVAAEALAHQELPFDKLIEALNPERRGNQTPLFQVLFVLQNTPRAPFGLPGVAVSSIRMQHEVSKYDISLFLNTLSDGIAGAFLYKKDLFDSDTIALMRSRFVTLLENLISSPDCRIQDLEMRSAAEQASLLAERDDLRSMKRGLLRSTTRQQAI